MRKGRVSDCILTSSHLIPVASAHAIWRVPRLVCVPPKSAFAPHCHTLGSMHYERAPCSEGRSWMERRLRYGGAEE